MYPEITKIKIPSLHGKQNIESRSEKKTPIGEIISVISVCFNESPTKICETLNSIINQDGVEVELIIIDGGSTDNTLPMILNNMDKRIHLVIENDNGIYDAMNKGFHQVLPSRLAEILRPA